MPSFQMLTKVSPDNVCLVDDEHNYPPQYVVFIYISLIHLLGTEYMILVSSLTNLHLLNPLTD
jgi:hypothetical protein